MHRGCSPCHVAVGGSALTWCGAGRGGGGEYRAGPLTAGRLNWDHLKAVQKRRSFPAGNQSNPGGGAKPDHPPGSDQPGNRYAYRSFTPLATLALFKGGWTGYGRCRRTLEHLKLQPAVTATPRPPSPLIVVPRWPPRRTPQQEK